MVARERGPQRRPGVHGTGPLQLVEDLGGGPQTPVAVLVAQGSDQLGRGVLEEMARAPRPVGVSAMSEVREDRERLRALAVERRRFGYRRLFVLLRREGEPSGKNRIYRLYREEGLTVRKRRSRRRAIGTRAPILVEARPNARWSLDFVHDQFATGRRFRILNVVDDVTRECLAAIPDTSISGRRVARELTALISRRGRPAMIVSDNGTEFTSTAILAWAQDHGVDWHYIAPGKPTQNGFVESFNGRMRDELLNESLFFSLDHARQKVAAWALDYNTRRPHSSIGYLTPEAFAASLTATGRPAAQDESCAARPVAHPTLRGVTNPRTLVAAG